MNFNENTNLAFKAENSSFKAEFCNTNNAMNFAKNQTQKRSIK